MRLQTETATTRHHVKFVVPLLPLERAKHLAVHDHEHIVEHVEYELAATAVWIDLPLEVSRKSSTRCAFSIDKVEQIRRTLPQSRYDLARFVVPSAKRLLRDRVSLQSMTRQSLRQHQ